MEWSRVSQSPHASQMRRLVLAVLACATVAIIGYAVVATRSDAGPTRASTSTTLPHGGSVLTATTHDNGRTVTLRTGQSLRVVLSSTYWTIRPMALGPVLRSQGRPLVVPRSSGCVPGGGCGTVTERFVPVAHGNATVRASRTSCGEAMGCTRAAGTFTLHVVVR